MSEEERDSCQLTELSAIERANVENDDKVAPFSLCNILFCLPELPMRCVMYNCFHTCQLKASLFSWKVFFLKHLIKISLPQYQ